MRRYQNKTINYEFLIRWTLEFWNGCVCVGVVGGEEEGRVIGQEYTSHTCTSMHVRLTLAQLYL